MRSSGTLAGRNADRRGARRSCLRLGKVEGHLTGERLVEDAEEGQRSMRRPHPVRRRGLHSRLCIRLLHDDARNWDVRCRHREKLGVGREGVGRAALVGERTAQLLAARAEVGRETAGAVDNVLSCWRAKAAAGAKEIGTENRAREGGGVEAGWWRGRIAATWGEGLERRSQAGRKRIREQR